MNRYILPAVLIGFIILTMSKKIRGTLSAVTGIGYKGGGYSSDISNIIYNTAKKEGLSDWMAAMMVAWAKWETGSYQSNFAKKYNSYFGMIYDKNSPYQIGYGTHERNNPNPISRYANIEDSVRDNIAWLKRRVSRQDRGAWPSLDSLNDIKEFGRLLLQSRYHGTNEGVYTGGLMKHFESKVSIFDP